jgi:hypothetical protein
LLPKLLNLHYFYNWKRFHGAKQTKREAIEVQQLEWEKPYYKKEYGVAR